MGEEDPNTLEPKYWTDRDEAIVLYRGGLQIAKPEQQPVPADGEVRFEWLPSPHLSFAAWYGKGDIPGALDPLVPGDATIDLAAPSEPLELRDYGEPQDAPKGTVVQSHGGFSPQEFGDPPKLQAVLLNIINFDNFVGTRTTRIGQGWARNRIELAANDWVVTLDARKDLRETISDLRGTGGFAFTHTAEISRSDASIFSAHDTNELRDVLFHFLAFARGRLVGLAMPVGNDTKGDSRWVRWDTTIVDPWRACLSWADHIHSEALEELFPQMATRWQDAFWRDVVRRAIRYYVDANDATPVDRALVMCQAALELLSWSVVVEDQRLLSARRARESSAADRIRMLLKWAQVDPMVPAQFADLIALSNDGPEAFTKVRNRLVHPAQSKPPYPTAQMIEAWRLGQYWVELCILRICNFTGVYGSRLVDDRWTGAVTRVPWSP